MSLEGKVLTRGSLIDLFGISVDNDGLVYVADRSNQRVQVSDLFDSGLNYTLTVCTLKQILYQYYASMYVCIS